MEEILLAVMAKLSEITSLRWVDINVGQMDSETPPVDYPCALVDVSSINYRSAGGRRQTGEALVEVELFFTVRSPSNSSAPARVREQAFKHFNTIKEVYVALQGLSGECFSGLNRVELKRDKTYFPRPFTLTFRCAVDDRDAEPRYDKLPVPPGIIFPEIQTNV